MEVEKVSPRDGSEECGGYRKGADCGHVSDPPTQKKDPLHELKRVDEDEYKTTNASLSIWERCMYIFGRMNVEARVCDEASQG